MAKVRKREWKSGDTAKTAWVADYFDSDGKRHIKTFKREREAKAWLVKTQHEVKEGIHAPESSSITVAEAADIWLETARLTGMRREGPLEKSTLRQYRNHVDRHIKPSRIGNEKLARLTAPAIEGFRDDLLKKKKPCSPVLARKVLTSLKSILSEAQRRGLVAQNVARSALATTGNRDQRNLEIGLDVPSKEEVHNILEAADKRWRPLLVVAVFTGMRGSELRGLTWSDVDFSREKVVHVRQRADLWGEMGPPKSKAGQRAIPMSPMVVNTLREWKLACPKGELGLVFPSASGGVEVHHHVVRRGFQPAQVAAGVVDAGNKPKYGLHSLRHFFASWAIEQGFSPKRLQTLLGHSSIQMTFDRYGHLFPSLEDDHAKFAAAELTIVG